MRIVYTSRVPGAGPEPSDPSVDAVLVLRMYCRYCLRPDPRQGYRNSRRAVPSIDQRQNHFNFESKYWHSWELGTLCRRPNSYPG